MSSPDGWYADPSDPLVQRYWNGSGWAARRVWNGAQWVDAAPATLPPVRPPTRRRHLGLWLGGTAALATVVTVVALAASAGSSHKGTGSVAAYTSGPATRPTPVASSAEPARAGSGNPIRAWENTQNASGRANGQIINSVEKDVATIGNDYSGQADSTTLETDCSQLSRDLVESQPTDSPDQAINRNLGKAFDYLVSGSVDCGVDDQAASTELNKAIDYLNAATAEIKSLGG